MANVLGMRGRVGAGRLQIVVRPGVFRVGEWVEQISFEQFSAPSADTNEVARVVRGIAPDVLEVDFDEPGKNFTRANVDNRTAVTALTSDEAAASLGDIFLGCDPTVSESRARYTRHDFAREVREHFDRAMANPILETFATKDLLARCRRDMHQFEKTRARLSPAVQAILMLSDIHFVVQ